MRLAAEASDDGSLFPPLDQLILLILSFLFFFSLLLPIAWVLDLSWVPFPPFFLLGRHSMTQFCDPLMSHL